MKRDSIAYFSLGHPYNISLKPPVTFSPYSVCEVRVNLGVNVIDTGEKKIDGFRALVVHRSSFFIHPAKEVLKEVITSKGY
jgi:hypothetical protein